MMRGDDNDCEYDVGSDSRSHDDDDDDDCGDINNNIDIK